MMKREGALRAILRAWQELPTSERQTESQLTAFAMGMAHNSDYAFRHTGDPYQDVIGYLKRRVPGLKKQDL